MKSVVPSNFSAANIYSISRVLLDEYDGVFRQAPRAMHDRQDNYDSLFDQRTLICDAFWAGGKISVIAPPPLNLLEDAALTLKVDSDEIDVFQTGNCLDRTFVAGMAVAQESATEGELRLSPAGTTAKFVIQPDAAERFEGKHVVVTQQKDNEVEWILSWINFYQTIHGYDSFLIYDNCSLRYTVGELRDTIVARFPSINVAIVDWNVPFGVTGGPQQRWDSDFGQHAAWEHARRRFLSTAVSALFVDVDELVVSDSGDRLTEQLGATETSAFRLNRFNMSLSITVPTDTSRKRKHTDYILRARDISYVSTKPGALMARLPETAQIKVHYVADCECPILEDFTVRHFTGLRLDWRNGSLNYSGQDVYASLEADSDLAIDFALYRDFLKLRRLDAQRQ